jgi:hypothetical protein
LPVIGHSRRSINGRRPMNHAEGHGNLYQTTLQTSRAEPAQRLKGLPVAERNPTLFLPGD